MKKAKGRGERKKETKTVIKEGNKDVIYQITKLTLRVLGSHAAWQKGNEQHLHKTNINMRERSPYPQK
jgi:hypothetical protein